MSTIKPELLAPVGSFEALTAAVKAKADSIYFGVGDLNMRSRSSFNFKLEDMKKIVKICNKENIKSYLTLNTILYDNDIKTCEQILKSAKKAGISAIIASDIAAIQLAHSMGHRVHISVQANVSNTDAVRFFSKYASVIVLARELTLPQIKTIVDNIRGKNGQPPILGPDGKHIKIEIFAHGALCVAISGKCYMSLAKYNASANRGSCYQNCRRAYRVLDETDGHEWIIDNKYVMSPKDICLIRCLDKFLNAGVEVFKLEGRGRSADYVYAVTNAYKQALISIQNGIYTPSNITKWENELKSVFNRGFWHGGYYLGESLDVWSATANNQATKKKIRVGIVNKYFNKINVAEIDLKEGNISVGDEIMIMGKTTGVEKAVLIEIRKDNKNIKAAMKGDIISVTFPTRVRKNDVVYLLQSTD